MTNIKSQPTKGITSSHHVLTFFLISGLTVFFAINNISWSVKYIFPLPELYDQAFFLNLSVIYLRAFENGGLISLVYSVLHSSPYHVPLFPLTTLPFYLIGGLSKNSAYLTNVIYMFIMLTSTYLIGEKLFRPKAGLLAIFMLSTFTVFIEYSRDYLFEFPMTAMFTWSMFCLIKTKWLQNRKWSILLGISLGLTLLIKTVAGIYIVGPLLWVVIKTFSFKEGLKNKAINFLLSFGICSVIAGVYYLPNLKTILWYLFHTGFGKGSIDCYGAGKISFFSISNFLLYPIATIEISASYPFLLFLIVILIILICSLTNRRFFNYIFEDKTLLWVWILAGYFLITLSPCKQLPRHIIPLIPAVVVLVCGLVINIPYKSLKVMALILIFIGGMINYVALTYGIKILPTVYSIGDTLLFSQKSLGSLNISNLSIELLPKLTNDPDGMSKAEYYRNLPEKPISNNNWKNNEILHEIKVEAEGSIDDLEINVVPNHFFFNANIFRYKADILDLKYQITNINREHYELHLESLDYVIAKTGFPGPDFANNDLNNHILGYLDSLDSGFEKMPWDFVLPDHSKAIIYKRKPRYEVLSSTPRIQQISEAIFEGGIQFLGYDVFFKSRKEDYSIIGITYYWKCLSNVTEDYTVFVHFVDSKDKILFQNDHPMINKEYPSGRCREDQIIAESHKMPISNNLLKGEYFIRVGLWIPDREKVISVLNQGNSIKDRMGLVVGGFHSEYDGNQYNVKWLGLANPEHRVKVPNLFIKDLTNAIIEAPKGKYANVAQSVFTINNDSRSVLFQHPPSKIKYKLKVPENSSLKFGIALNPEVWSEDKGDGVTFEILAKDGNEERKLFSKYIDPKNKVKDRKWHDEIINMSEYGGKEVELSFITKPGFGDNTDYDWAGWGNPMLISNSKFSETE